MNSVVPLTEQCSALGMADNDIAQPRSRNIGPEISPVKAPCCSQCTFCAPRAMWEAEPKVVPTDSNAVNGGASTISTEGSGGACQFPDEPDGLRGRLVHLPIANNEGGTHGGR